MHAEPQLLDGQGQALAVTAAAESILLHLRVRISEQFPSINLLCLEYANDRPGEAWLFSRPPEDLVFVPCLDICGEFLPSSSMVVPLFGGKIIRDISGVCVRRMGTSAPGSIW